MPLGYILLSIEVGCSSSILFLNAEIKVLTHHAPFIEIVGERSFIATLPDYRQHSLLDNLGVGLKYTL